MKKLMVMALSFAVMAGLSIPAFADGAAANDDGSAQVKNVRSGARNTSAGWVEVLDSTHAEASKGKNMGEHLTGVVAGGAVGVRKTIHRLGAGVIDLVTFWIPKKNSLITPETARLT